MELARQYIVNEKDERIAVQLDIETFNKIEDTLENFALYSLMQTDNDDELLDLQDAKSHYEKLKS
ncbi:MAG: hypothetical protein KDK39_15960 [Leptospiraceae bacterium]|nr:hypothetical protein [Leptospiraceae bacterium]